MKKILLFTSILFLTITTSSFAQSPTISNAFISQPILCNGVFANDEMQIEINQTASPTTYSCVVGFYAGGSSFFVSYLSTNQTSSGLLNLNGFSADVDYCIRIVDSVAYYAGNLGSANGTSIIGVYDEFCAVNFPQPAQLVASTSIVTSNLCVGDCIAVEELLISGGADPFNFTFEGGTSIFLLADDSTYSFTDLCAGQYDIIVTDANGCSTSPSTSSFIIAPIQVIVPAGTVTTDFNGFNVSCNGASDGIINASASGGTGVFTYSIDGVNFQPSAIFSDLSAASYIITYKDANDCIATEGFVLNEPTVLSGTANVTQNVDCFGSSTGEITFTLDPLDTGVPPYDYSLDNFTTSQPNDPVFDNLIGDSLYVLIVKDNNGCAFTSTVYLPEPTQIFYSTILSDYNSYEVSCNDSSNGSIEFISPIGGLAPYTYSIDGGVVFNLGTSYPNLSAGIYNIEVKDASSCIDSKVVTLDEPALFSVTYLVDNEIACAGDCNGAIAITPSNGVGQILFSINAGAPQTTPYFSGLCGGLINGSYILDAVDINGCITDTTISFSDPIEIEYNTSSTTEYCAQSNGQASISVTSVGTGPVSYSWNTNPAQNTAVANNLVGGTYVVLVNYGNSCSVSESVVVAEDIGFTVSLSIISPCLGDSSGSVTATSTGLPTISYQWSDINGIITGETSATLSNMPIGTYSVVVTDATFCSIAESIDIIPAFDPIVIDSLVVTNSSCYGINDAQIEIFASGGQQPYSYSNTSGLNYQFNPVFGMLAANTYGIQAKDLNGCFDDTSITLSYPNLLVVDSTVFTHISCFGLDDGAVQDIQFVGGTGPFEFSIDGGPLQTYMLFSGLEPGQHTVEIEDANNCASSDIIFINEPEEMILDSILVSNWNNYQIRCNGDSSGYIYLEFSGGTVPYLTDSTTFWNITIIDSILAGFHTFIVQDANGCIYQDSILFEEPSAVEHNFITTNINCAAWNNGSITDSVYGGVGSATTYSYLWDSGETTYSLSNLSAGTYAITVTDENGCEDTDSVVINDDYVFKVDSLSGSNVGCFDDCDGELSVTASGGVPFTGPTSYTYLWNDYLGQNTDTAIGLCVDSIALLSLYNCIVTDAVGCSETFYFILTQPEELQVDITIEEPISCNGLSDGKLKANVTVPAGGTAPYNYTWSNGETSSLIDSLSLGIYKVIVEDANTCRDTFEIYLKEPDAVEIFSIQEFDISCFGYNDGYIEVLGIGGTSFELTYSYTLYLNGTPVADTVNYEAGSIASIPYPFTNLSPGNYYVIAKDRNGCEVTSLSVEITEPFAPLTLLVDTVDETCLLNAPGQNGIIRIFPEGGSQSFKYFIDGDSTSIFSPNALISQDTMLPGWHYIKVKDSRGCEITDSTFIKSYRSIFMNPDSVAFIDTTICLGQSITINVDERPDLIYTWDDGVAQIDGTREIKPEGILPYGTINDYITDYFVTVTDLQGCEIQNTVTVHFYAIDPMIDSDPGVLYGEYPVVLEGGNIDLFSNNTGNDIEYTWKWADNIIINTGDNSITISGALADVWYYLDIKDADGCLGYDSIYVVVGVKALAESTVYEAITPNNDGFNDTWTPLNIKSYKNALVQVFNRWGGLVFESNGGIDYKAWDGTNNGKELAVGTYYYIIDLNTGDEPQTGPVTIIR
jgi:gliding motility-associated-like protein